MRMFGLSSLLVILIFCFILAIVLWDTLTSVWNALLMLITFSLGGGILWVWEEIKNENKRSKK